MATPAPPFGGMPPTPPTDMAPPAEEDQVPCPVCQGVGQIPASMSRDEILTTLDQNMPGPTEELSQEIPPTTSAPPFSRTPPMTEEQTAEVGRLGERARGRMKERNFGY